jgi:hypothetical protein
MQHVLTQRKITSYTDGVYDIQTTTGSRTENNMQTPSHYSRKQIQREGY